LTLRLREEERAAVVGIALHNSPKEMMGKKLMAMTNLKPDKLQGIESDGMVTAVSANNQMRRLVLNRKVPSSTKMI